MSKEVLFVEQKVCEINGLRVSYIDEGAPVKGTVLLLHGWGVTASLYHLVIGHLATRYRVVAPDLPGFGGSQEPSAPWCVADYADFIKAFAAGVGVEEAVLVGHSYGCRIAIRLLADKALPVKKAVFMGAAGVKPRRSLWFYIRQAGYKCGRWFLSLPPVIIKETLSPNRFSRTSRNAFFAKNLPRPGTSPIAFAIFNPFRNFS